MWYPVYLTVRVDVETDSLKSAREIASKLTFGIGKNSSRFDDIIVGVESLGINEQQMDRLYKPFFLLRGKHHYQEFCDLFNGKAFSEVDDIVKSQDLAYGALSPKDGEGMVDINYKSICATVSNENGICKVTPNYEVWGEHDSTRVFAE